ncbi:unnamed protein product [Durusdinium trenchii]|uniref:Uncharacterized protein n=1 Tax=Durusdinium trenchii TaxID=1381693 RepID=A0ABP0HEL9_9DINO
MINLLLGPTVNQERSLPNKTIESQFWIADLDWCMTLGRSELKRFFVTRQYTGFAPDGSSVLVDSQIGHGCTLGACTSLEEGEVLSDETVVVAPGLRHLEPGAREAHVQAVSKFIEVLKETLPRCHHLRKSNVKT